MYKTNLRLLSIALILSAITYAADDPAVTAVTNLNQRLRLAPNRTLLTERAKLLKELIVRKPSAAKRLVFSAQDSELLQPFAEPGMVENFQSGTTSTVLIADGEDRASSAHVYFLDTPAGRVTAYQDSAEAPASKCGDQIQVNGFRLGDVMAVTETSVVRAADPQPNCTPLGEHKVAVLMMRMPGISDLIPTADQIKQQFFDTTGASTATFYQENSLGQASITGDVFGPFTLDRAYTCDEYFAVVSKAVSLADKTVDFSQYTHVQVLMPRFPGGCPYSGYGSIGCSVVSSPSKGTLKIGWVFEFVSSTYLLRESTHELGHNFGLGHSRTVEFPGETLAPDRTHALYTEYGDQFASMGGTDAYHFAAPHKQMLKWFTDGTDFQTVSGDLEFDLPPVETQTQTIRALRVQRKLGRPNEWVWIEYRQPLGKFDSKMSPTAWQGATLHYQSAETGLYSEAIDATPRAAGQSHDSFGDITLLPGRTWQDPYSDLTIEVVSATPTALKVRVRYEKPCATVTWPKTLAQLSSTGQLLFTVAASPGCSFASTANNYWLTAADDGTSIFNYAENTDGGARSGSVTVARQTLFVTQQGKRILPTVSWVSPVSGSVPSNSGGTTFTVNINAPGGAASIGLVDLQIGDPSTGACHLRFDFPNRKLYLFPDTGATLLSGTTVTNKSCTASSPGFATVAAPNVYQVTASLSLDASLNGSRDILASVGYATDAAPPALQKLGTFTVTQACEPGLSFRRLSVAGAGASYSLSVTANSSCTWSIAATDPWVKVSQPSGTGSATVLVTVAANTGSDIRSTTVTVADEIIPVFQAAGGMPFYPSVQFNDSEILLSRLSGTGTLYFSTNLPASALKAVSDSDWLHVTSTGINPLASIGPYFNYAFDANLAPNRRVGSVTINGATVYFTQAPSVARPVPDYLISTFAGTSDIGDGGPAAQAFLSSPGQLTYDAAGNLYLAESDYYRIRKITPDGTISTVAGTGLFGSANDGDPAASSPLLAVRGVAVDSKGRLYISENTRIRRVEDDGTYLTVVSGLSLSSGIAFDNADNLYITDTNTNRILRYSSSGRLTTVAGTGVAGYTGDGGQATAARLFSPSAVAVDASGNILVCDTGNYAIRQIAGGVITTLAGNGRLALVADGAIASKSGLYAPQSVAVDASGAVYIGEFGRVRTIDGQGALLTLAGGGTARQDVGSAAKSVTLGSLTGLAIGSGGQIVYSDASNQIVRSVGGDKTIAAAVGHETWASLGDGGPASAANLYYPYNGALGKDGSLYFADRRNNRVRRIAPDGTIDTVAGTGQYGYSGDKGPGKSALLNSPTSLALDGDGNLYIADSGNNRIRKLDTNGVITTFAGDGVAAFKGDGNVATSASLNGAVGVALDGMGNLYIADTLNSRIRLVTPDGKISTVAGKGTIGFAGDGGPATSALMYYPYSVAADGLGNVYFDDAVNARIRKISSDGTISTVAGSGRAASGDSNYAINTGLGTYVYGLMALPTGELWIADSNYNRILQVLPDGSLYVMAGTANAGGDGDGGPAWNASVNYPTGVLFDGAGKFYIFDAHNNRIRLLQ